jgi:plastocyanin
MGALVLPGGEPEGGLMAGLRRTVAAGGLVLLLAAPFPAGAIDETAQKPPTMPVGKVHEVVVEKDTFAFSPQRLTAQPGDVVRWTNRDAQNHLVVTQDPKVSTQLLVYKTLKPGESYEHQFQQPDHYNFFCAIHFQMWGTVGVAR